MNYLKNTKGITLIALVVTIIVLIILVGISINLILGENGIITKSQEAKESNRGAKVKETVYMAVNENQMAKDTGGTATNTKESVIEKLKLDKNITDAEIAEIIANNKVTIGKIEIDFSLLDGADNIAISGKIVVGKNATYMDSTGTITIPVGFAVVTDPDTIENGLVISDVEGDDMANSKKGNQFVWIPVPDYSKFHLIEGYSNEEIELKLSDETDPVREAGSSKTEVLPGKPNASNSVLGTDESVAMYKSVKDNKGFYIARFEAGIANLDEDGTPVNNKNLETKVVADGSVKPLSQKGVGVWNGIAWGGTSENIATDGLVGDDTQNGAVKVARSMYTKSDTCGVTSTLCYGVQWDAIMNFIDSEYYKMDGTLYEKGSFVADGTERGIYESYEELTGNYEIKHIYDLAGNAAEWTMEATTTCRVLRSGFAMVSGYLLPSSSRYLWSPDGTYYNRI